MLLYWDLCGDCVHKREEKKKKRRKKKQTWHKSTLNTLRHIPETGAGFFILNCICEEYMITSHKRGTLYYKIPGEPMLRCFFFFLSARFPGRDASYTYQHNYQNYVPLFRGARSDAFLWDPSSFLKKEVNQSQIEHQERRIPATIAAWWHRRLF